MAAASAEIRVRVNGGERAVPPDTCIRGLVALLGLESRRVAVAVNRHVVPRSSFANHRLCDGDRVEILEAVGGG